MPYSYTNLHMKHAAHASTVDCYKVKYTEVYKVQQVEIIQPKSPGVIRAL